MRRFAVSLAPSKSTNSPSRARQPDRGRTSPPERTDSRRTLGVDRDESPDLQKKLRKTASARGETRQLNSQGEAARSTPIGLPSRSAFSGRGMRNSQSRSRRSLLRGHRGFERSLHRGHCRALAEAEQFRQQRRQFARAMSPTSTLTPASSKQLVERFVRDRTSRRGERADVACKSDRSRPNVFTSGNLDFTKAIAAASRRRSPLAPRPTRARRSRRAQ